MKLHEVEIGVQRRLAYEWACLDESEKEKWVLKETKDRERYIQELKYAPKRMSFKTRPRRKGPRLAPKRVLTPYMFYVKEVRPRMMRELPEMSFVEIMRKIGADWSKLDED